MTWTANIVTLFPEAFPGCLGLSIPGRALAQNLWALKTVNIRDFAHDRHRTVDNTPFGGGAGMVLRPDVLDEALQSLGPQKGPVVYLSPRGRVMSQKLAHQWSQEPDVTLICGRYEGVDQRFLDKNDIQEVSLGDFVLSGGEPAALAILDSVVRLLPNVLGQEKSLEEESFANGLLEYPHYTRPAHWESMDVPAILLSGHHQAIHNWRHQQAQDLTKKRRPDLWAVYQAEQAGIK